jgi:hypothetical protein
MITNCSGRSCAGTFASSSASGLEFQPSRQAGRMIDQQARVPQGLVHHPRRVERMKPLAAMLHDQDFRPIVDAGNRGTVAIAMRPEASEAAIAAEFDQRGLRSF